MRKKMAAPGILYPALFLFLMLIPAGCASTKLPSLGQVIEAGDLPPHLAQVQAAGYSPVQIDARSLAPGLISELYNLPALTGSLGAHIFRDVILVLDVPPLVTDSPAMSAYASLALTSAVVGRRLEAAGFSYEPVERGLYRTKRWVRVGEDGAPVVITLVEAGLYQISVNTSETVSDALLTLLLEAENTGVSESGDGVSNARLVAAGASAGGSSVLLNLPGGNLTGIEAMRFIALEDTDDDFTVFIDAQVETRSSMQARALRSLMRIVLLHFIRDMYPDEDAAELRERIHVQSDGQILTVEQLPLFVPWLGQLFAEDDE